MSAVVPAPAASGSIVELMRVINGISVNAYYEWIAQFAGPQGIVFDPRIGGHLVARYAVCSELLADAKRLGRPGPPDLGTLAKEAAVTADARLVEGLLLFERDDATYARRKRALAAFAARRTVSPARLAELARDHLDRSCSAGQDGPVDVVRMLREYNFACARELVGVDAELDVAVKRDLLKAVMFLDGKRSSRAFVVDALGAFVRLKAWLEAGFAEAPPADVDLNDLTLLFVTANESVSYLLATYYATAASTPDDGPVRPLLNECLRFDSPIQLTKRVARTAFAIDGHAIEAGEAVFLHIGAANRDKDAFAHPDRFEIGRSGAALSFGSGLSRCVGAGFGLLCATAFIETARGTHRIAIDPTTTAADHGLAGRGLKTGMGTIEPIVA